MTHPATHLMSMSIRSVGPVDWCISLPIKTVCAENMWMKMDYAFYHDRWRSINLREQFMRVTAWLAWSPMTMIRSVRVVSRETPRFCENLMFHISVRQLSDQSQQEHGREFRCTRSEARVVRFSPFEDSRICFVLTLVVGKSVAKYQAPRPNA